MLKRYVVGNGIAALCGAGLVLGALASPAHAEAERVGFEAGADVYNQYFFRGFLEEDSGFIFQPWAEASFNLYQAPGEPIDSAGLTVGQWNSLHSKHTDAAGSGPALWYESDFYAELGATAFEVLSFDAIYTAYMSPSGAFSTVQEIALAVGYDDSQLWTGMDFALNPYVLLAKKVAGSSDAYMELGIEPGMDVDAAGLPVALSFPIAVGLSLDDYYVTEADDEVFYGFTQAGVTASPPLTVIPAAYGEWELGVGAHYLHLGQAARESNDGDKHEFIGSIGLSTSF